MVLWDTHSAPGPSQCPPELASHTPPAAPLENRPVPPGGWTLFPGLRMCGSGPCSPLSPHPGHFGPPPIPKKPLGPSFPRTFPHCPRAWLPSPLLLPNALILCLGATCPPLRLLPSPPPPEVSHGRDQPAWPLCVPRHFSRSRSHLPPGRPVEPPDDLEHCCGSAGCPRPVIWGPGGWGCLQLGLGAWS